MLIRTTARLRLRTACLDDAAFYLALLNSPTFVAQLGDRGLRTLDDARVALAEGPIRMQAQYGHSLYIAETHDGTPVGMCGLIRRMELDGVDLGYAFLPQYQGYGFAHEAALAATLHAHETLGIQRLLAIVSPENTRSISVLQKIGFVFARIVLLRTSDSGTLLYEHRPV
ncbi:MAG: GNAT family N-acetyltransferase [Gammaproteobacteria bacterium]